MAWTSGRVNCWELPQHCHLDLFSSPLNEYELKATTIPRRIRDEMEHQVNEDREYTSTK